MSHSAVCGGRGCARPGFTLTELLVAVTILSMLAAMVWGALIVSRLAAREAATRATIAKLHNIIMAKYESYRTRRIPIDTTGATPLQAAQARLLALRDIMRMEMPERWSDIQNGPLYVPNAPSTYLAYRARCIAGNKLLIPSHPNAPSECLYLIITMACGEDARRQLRPAEVADTDGDGFPEIVDGWGRPIYFLRWAPGFNDSDLQPNVVLQAELEATLPGHEEEVWTSANVLTRRQAAAQEDHDPFDPRRIDLSANPSSADDPPRGWRLVPLIYSAGADGKYGLSLDPQTGPYTWTGLPVRKSHYAMGWGLPTRKDGSWVHYDNIHNHRLEAR